MDENELKDHCKCQYCYMPLNATEPTGIYECPNCLKHFPDTRSVKAILESESALQSEVSRLTKMVMGKCEFCEHDKNYSQLSVRKCGKCEDSLQGREDNWQLATETGEG